jgi:hypothetical protein
VKLVNYLMGRKIFHTEAVLKNVSQSFTYSSTMKLEAIRSFEKSAELYQTTRHHIPELPEIVFSIATAVKQLQFTTY